MHMGADLIFDSKRLTKMKLKEEKETMTKISGSRTLYTDAKIDNNYESHLLRVPCLMNEKSHPYMHKILLLENFYKWNLILSCLTLFCFKYYNLF